MPTQEQILDFSNDDWVKLMELREAVKKQLKNVNSIIYKSEIIRRYIQETE